MNEVFQQFGFENAAEFHRMVASVDLSSGAKLAAFRQWQEEDGSKDGLARLAASATNGESAR